MRRILSLFALLAAWPALACDPSPGIPGEDVSLSLEHDGVTRTFVLHLPADYDCETPLPLVVGVHGYGGSGVFFENEWAGIFDAVNEQGFIGLFPDGLHPSPKHTDVRGFNDLTSRHDDGPDGLTCKPPPRNYPKFDNCPEQDASRTCPWGNSCADDLGYFRRLIEGVRDTWAVDPARIYMVGYSQGGSTVNGLAPHLADLLAAVTPLHGFAANGYAMGPDAKLPFLLVWGREDMTVRGDGQPSNDGLIYDTPEETLAAWAESQGCEAAGDTPWASVSDGRQGWSCTQHAACQDGSEVVGCSWDGAHVWPSDQAGNFGWDVIWSFFEKYKKQIDKDKN